ncbi:MAG TPA: CPBP family intramembrane glutamic endopeptidase [Candidatus Cybelea sp.]|nr:CPBP family intramembrane glutamic endopeptidase [Candidatus Cybelea sp.]
MHWDFAIILIFLGVIAPALGYRRVRRLIKAPSITMMERLTLYASTIAFQWLAVAVILWRAAAHGIHPSGLGMIIPYPALTATLSLVLSVLAFANQLVGIRRLSARPSEIKGPVPQLVMKIFPQNEIERLAFAALTVTVALCEELIYRGFVQRVLEDSAGGAVLAGVFGSAALFALAHLYQGRRGLVSTFIVGIIFASIRSWTGSLVPTAAAHFVADLTIGLLGPGRLRRATQGG